MHLKIVIAALVTLSLSGGSVMADELFRSLLTTGGTSASSYLTSSDHKIVTATQEDASSFVASNGSIRGPYVETAIQKIRAENPSLKATDMELASAILVKQ
ncbi:DUF2388 domain-containing protein [Pseudomonas lini]